MGRRAFDALRLMLRRSVEPGPVRHSTNAMPNDGGRAKPDRGAIEAFPLLAGAAIAVVAALRVLTLARDCWEWDELLFTAAAREGFDVRANQPHPPGYPLFVLPARLLVWLGSSPFDATLGVAAVAGIAAVVLLMFLARELGAEKEEALFCGLLWASIPAVWLHSVRPLSDPLGAAAFFLAVGLLVRQLGNPSTSGLVTAAVAAGACAGVRPQVAASLLPLAIVVALRAAGSWPGRRRAALAALAGVVATVLPYVPVVAGSGGLRQYLSASRIAAEYVTTFESPRLSQLATAALWERWLVDPFGGPLPAAAVWLAAGAGVVLARSSAAGLLAIAFLPLLAVSVATLSSWTAPRYALPLLAAAPLAASLGLTRLGRHSRRGAALLATLLLGAMAFTAAPAVVEVATRPSPPVAAMAALRDDPGLVGRPLLLAPALLVHERDLGPRVPVRMLEEGRPAGAPPGALVVTNDGGPAGLSPLRRFSYESPLLARISRGRYLVVTIWDGAGAGVLRLGVEGPGFWDAEHGLAVLTSDSQLVVEAESEVEMEATVVAGGEGARLLVESTREELTLAAGERWRLKAKANPSTRIRLEEGGARLSGWRFRGANPGAAVAFQTDDFIPASVDNPAEGAVVAGPLFVRGWCQETGGSPVRPVAFRIDGKSVEPARLVRTSRPDVAAVIPSIGDASHAGYEATFAPRAVSPGTHVLEVVFEAGDRRRVYPVRRFVLSGGAPASPAAASR